jgi:hypothetical protein
MANFTRTQIDATWVTGYQVTPADLQDLSRKCVEGINGTVGGAWAPTAQIVVNGAGMHLTGPVEVRGSGKLVIASGATITLGDNDFQDLLANHPGRKRTIWQAMAPVKPLGTDNFAIANLVPSGAVQPLASALRRSTGDSIPAFLKELRVHNGARLTKVRLRFRVATPHASAPQETPKVRLFRVRNSDGLVENLSSTRDGFVSITMPKSGGTWYNAGEVQEFAIVPDQNTTINNADYAYFAHVVEERAGVNEYPFTLPVYEAVTIDVASNAPNPLTGDLDSRGSAWPVGSVGLFKDELQKLYNGLWVAPGGAGAWTRHPTLNSQAQFKNGMLFVVSSSLSGSGKSNPGTVWQMTLAQPFTFGTSDVNIGKPVPQGTIFLGFALDFEDILTTSFQ